jgi:SnoaL-like polyketide cyclase
VYWRAEGTFTGPIGGIPPTNEKVVFHGHTCFRCLDGKVIEHWAAVDYRPLQSSQGSKRIVGRVAGLLAPPLEPNVPYYPGL